MKEVILHHSASTFGNAALIDHWHRAAPKYFDMNGYHWVVLNGCLTKGVYREMYDGLIETGRDLNRQGAHVLGHNEDTVGICLIGDSKTPFTRRQLAALDVLLRQLRRDILLPGENLIIKQHSDYDQTKPHCAGLNTKLISDYINMI